MLSALVPGDAVKFALLCVAAACAFGPQPIIWKFPSSFLQGASVAAGLAMVNSVGNLGGFVAQVAIPWVRTKQAARSRPCSSWPVGCCSVAFSW